MKIRKSIQLHKKAASILLVLFVWSTLAIALDQHDEIYAATCPICHAKSDINGTQNSFELHTHYVSTYYNLTEKLFNVTIPVILFREGRAPPGSFQI